MKAPSTVRNLHAHHLYQIETEEPLRRCLKVATLYERGPELRGGEKEYTGLARHRRLRRL